MHPEVASTQTVIMLTCVLLAALARAIAAHDQALSSIVYRNKATVAESQITLVRATSEHLICLCSKGARCHQ